MTFSAIKTPMMHFDFMPFQIFFMRERISAMETAVMLIPLEHGLIAGVAKVVRVR